MTKTALTAYRERFAGIETGLAAEVARGTSLIQELLNRLETTETELRQTKLDLDNDREARRRLQQEAQVFRERQGRRPFVAVLIDADGYVFHDSFLTRGEKGGEDAADALLASLRSHVRQVVGPVDGGVDLVVRAFANVGGLAGALERDDRLPKGTACSQLRAFVAGFSLRHGLFDFVDIGHGKERADFKIRENVKFFIDSFSCRHLVVACGHDAGYAPFLGQLAGDREVRERVTLLESSSVFPPAIRDLGFQNTRFDAVFGICPQKEAPGSAKPAWEAGALPGLTTNGGSTGKAAAAPSSPAAPEKVPNKFYSYNVVAQSRRMGPVVKEKDGRRKDRPLAVDMSIVERLKKVNPPPCFYLYLRGECVLSVCYRNHAYRQLSDKEFDALWWLARQQPCFKHQKAGRNQANDCTDPFCIYGHKNGNR